TIPQPCPTSKCTALCRAKFGRSVQTKQEDTMAPFRNVITAPAAWTSRGIGGKAGLTQRLTDAQLAAFDTALASTRHLKPQQATRDDFDHPEINALADALRAPTRHGG